MVSAPASVPRSFSSLRVALTFRLSAQDTLDDSIDLYEWRNGEWAFMHGISVAPMPLLHESEIVALLKEGKHEEIESYRYTEPATAVFGHVDQMLKGMGWRRASELHTFPLDSPVRPGTLPNRFADIDVKRGWRERRYLAAVRRAIKTQRGSAEYRKTI